MNHVHDFRPTGREWPQDRQCACGSYRIEQRVKARWRRRAEELDPETGRPRGLPTFARAGGKDSTL